MSNHFCCALLPYIEHRPILGFAIQRRILVYPSLPGHSDKTCGSVRLAGLAGPRDLRQSSACTENFNTRSLKKTTDQTSRTSGIALLYLIFILALSPLVSWADPPPLDTPTRSWPGWPNIEYMVVFGDSYTTTRFDTSGDQPSRANPLGNPPFPGTTSSNGPNWVDFLTTVYNESFIRTANLAYGGATLDPALKSAQFPGILSLREQIEDEYLPIYANHPEFFEWKAETTLFAIWIGINDVHDSDLYNSTILDVIFDKYRSLVEELFTSGARNFLFFNVPPLELAPNVVRAGPEEQRIHKTNVEVWNQNLTRLATELREEHTNTTAFVFDAHKFFDEVIEDPCSHPETCAYKNTTWYCDYCQYPSRPITPTRTDQRSVDIFGTPDWYTKFPECPYTVDQYFWLNDLHPTFRVHNMTARQVVKQLTS